MSSKPVKKVRYTSSTKGSSVHGGTSSTHPPSSKPSSSTRRLSFSHQRHPSDSGVGSSSSNSATAHVNSTSFYTDAERSEQGQNIRALNEALNTLKDQVKVLEHEKRGLQNDLSERNHERREFRRENDELRLQNEELRRQCEEHLRTIDDLKKEKSRAKESRDGKDSDGIRVRGSDSKTTPEKKDRSEKVPASAERNTPPMPRREKERDSSARREEEHLRAQHQARERRTSYRDAQAPPSPLYRDEDASHARARNAILARLLARNTRIPLARRPSVSYGSSPGGYTSASQAYPSMTMGSGYGRRERDEVPYIRGEVPVSVNVGMSGGSRGQRLSGSGNADLYPNDGMYHAHPLEI
ncbi:hypothetical protein EYC84_009758 [Monilinia fructicola]|uniref:Uncharacterized protein n=1 Tax=Monilinia fructicola TaxID=38448 RepID=A0A5M9JDG3_MONFR|nr:hypothetical protein EYC84_009758 [Monilinia fructicola]